MSQHDFNIGNQLFPATRTDLNNALVALASNSSGTSAPSTTYANQFWYETDTNKLKIRNESNSAWIEIATLDQSGGTVQSIATAGLTLASTAISATGAEINQLDAITRGSILYGNASGATARLAKGGAGTVLSSDGTDISWAAPLSSPNGTEFISSVDISNVADYSFTGFDSSKYDSYFFTFLNVVSAEDIRNFQLVTSTDGGSNYDTGSADYNWNYSGRNIAAVGGYSLDSSSIALTFQQGTAAGEEGGASGHMYIYGPHLAQPTRIIAQTNFYDRNGYRYIIQVGGERHSSGDVDACRFKFNTGNIASGTITAYGLKNS
mgnify:CR=1 FL=1